MTMTMTMTITTIYPPLPFLRQTKLDRKQGGWIERGMQASRWNGEVSSREGTLGRRGKPGQKEGSRGGRGARTRGEHLRVCKGLVVLVVAEEPHARRL
eukprot:3394826-Rhodomonas_salina.1